MKHFSRRTALRGTGALIATYGAWRLGAPLLDSRPRASLKTESGKRPNILLIVTDQERARHLLPVELPLPHHDRLAEASTVFSNASAVSNLCSMARGVIYTGLHPQHNGVWENTPLPYSKGLRKDIPTLGTMMQDAGYTTGYFGKWHLTHFPVGEKVGKEKVAQVFSSYGFEYSDQDADRDGAQAGWLHDPAAAESTSRFIHGRKGGDKPWFAAVNLVNPHDIMFYKTSQQQFDTRVSRLPDDIEAAPDDPIFNKDWRIPLPENFGIESLAGKPAAHSAMRRVMELVLGEIPIERRDLWTDYNNYYYNCLRDMDRSLGVVLDALADSDQDQDTIVMYVSDHGEMGGVHGLREKGGNMYREDQNIPFMIRHPGIAAGRTVEALASHLDIVPTLLSLVGVNEAEWRAAYPALKGFDLSSVLNANAPDSVGPRDAHLAQWTSLIHLSEQTILSFSALEKAQGPINKLSALDFGTSLDMFQHRGHMRGIRQGSYKFARYFSPLDHHVPNTLDDLSSRNDLELYDTVKDPMEITNLANDLATYGPLIEKLNLRLNKLIADEVGVDDGAYLPGPNAIWKG